MEMENILSMGTDFDINNRMQFCISFMIVQRKQFVYKYS